MFIAAWAQVKIMGGRMVLCHVDSIRSMLNTTENISYFEIFNTEADACKAVGAPLPEFVAN